MKDILKTLPKEDKNPKVFNFLDASQSAAFYDQFYNPAYVKKEKPGDDAKDQKCFVH